MPILKHQQLTKADKADIAGLYKVGEGLFYWISVRIYCRVHKFTPIGRRACPKSDSVAVPILSLVSRDCPKPDSVAVGDNRDYLQFVGHWRSILPPACLLCLDAFAVGADGLRPKHNTLLGYIKVRHQLLYKNYQLVPRQGVAGLQ